MIQLARQQIKTVYHCVLTVNTGAPFSRLQTTSRGETETTVRGHPQGEGIAEGSADAESFVRPHLWWIPTALQDSGNFSQAPDGFSRRRVDVSYEASFLILAGMSGTKAAATGPSVIKHLNEELQSLDVSLYTFQWRVVNDSLDGRHLTLPWHIKLCFHLVVQSILKCIFTAVKIKKNRTNCKFCCRMKLLCVIQREDSSEARTGLYLEIFNFSLRL